MYRVELFVNVALNRIKKYAYLFVIDRMAEKVSVCCFTL